MKDAALGQLGDLAGRKAELAQQAANGTLSDTDRLALNQEDAALTEEMNRIVATSEFNGVNVFDNSVTAQVGTDSSANSQLTVGGTDVASLVSSLSSQNISTQESARASLDAVQSFTSSIAQKRGEVGATQSRLSSVSNQVEDRKLNESQALSRIQDLDVAEETASLVRSKILTQSGSALLAQAGKLNADNVKSLLG